MLIIELQVVSSESAQLGMPGDRENVVKLSADHRTVCKFGPSQTDRHGNSNSHRQLNDPFNLSDP